MRAALVGNPNVGKSVIFQALTGRYAAVSNFPGTTVEMSHGRLGAVDIVDTPGVYGLSRFNDEERVAVAALDGVDLVVNVVDARHLPRDLFLTLQLLDLHCPLLVVLNMMDEVRRDGVFLDAEGLEQALGVPVVKAAGVRGEGVAELKAWILAVPKAPPPPQFWDLLPPAVQKLPPLERLLWWEEDERATAAAGVSAAVGNREAVYAGRRERADRLARACFHEPKQSRWQERVDDWLLHPLAGTAFLAGILFLVYEIIGVFVANTLVTWLERGLALTWVPWIRGITAMVFPPGGFGYRVFSGEFGVLTMAVTYVAALLLPLIIAFYLLLAAMEDSGYLPRLATMLDRWFLSLGLNGRAVIPLVLGFGCVTMATLTTRILNSRRERAIATILLAWTIPCSAQMGVITGLLSGLGLRYALWYAGIILAIFIAVGTVLDHTLPGRPTPLLLDLPPLRWPRPVNVLKKTQIKVAGFLWEAVPLFALGTLMVELASWSGLLGRLERAVGPFMQGWLHLPAQTASAFILGFIRRDFGTVGLYQSGLGPHQILTGAVTLTLFVPCIASTLVLIRERGLRGGVAIWMGSIGLALLTGGIIARVAP